MVQPCKGTHVVQLCKGTRVIQLCKGIRVVQLSHEEQRDNSLVLCLFAS